MATRSHTGLWLATAVVAAGCVGISSHASAAAINVALADSSLSTTTGNPDNFGIYPLDGQVPKQVTIPVAPGQTYDAADTSDSGTTWNSLATVNTPPTTASSATPGDRVLYQTNIPLVDSQGATTPITLSVSAIEGKSKSNYIHSGHTTAAGTDGLLPNPGNTTGGTGADNGFSTGDSFQAVMGNEWIANGGSDGMSFTLSGLAAGQYNVYVYGSGNTNGQGATFTLSAANGGGSAMTNSDLAASYHSVFDSTGIDPAPEKGLSWNLLTATVDSSGILTFDALASASGIKPAVNGFQIDAVSAPVPEPASLGLLGLGGLALLRRRRKA